MHNIDFCENNGLIVCPPKATRNNATLCTFYREIAALRAQQQRYSEKQRTCVFLNEL